MTSLKIVIGFGLALAFSVLLGIVGFSNAQRFLSSSDELDQSRQKLVLQEEFLGKLSEAESDAITFLVTGNQSCLQSYKILQGQLMHGCQQLKRLCSEDPLQAHRVDHVCALAARKLKAFQQLISTKESNGGDKAAVALSADKTTWMSLQIRKTLAEFRHEEERRLEKELQAARKATKTTKTQLVMGGSCTVLLLIAIGVFFLRDLGARRITEETLANERNLLRSLVETIPDQVYVKDRRGRYILDNAAHRAFLGINKTEEIEGKTAFQLMPKAAAKDAVSLEDSVLGSATALRSFERLTAGADSKEVWLSTSKVPFRGASGEVVGLVCVETDISERKRSEESLRLLAAQLEQSNRELQDFASVASHDLQEPLRKIQAFTQRLRDKCASALGELGLQYLERVEGATGRMQVLIQDLLTLSRVTSNAAPFVPVDLSQVVREVLSDLEIAVEASGATVKLGDLPVLAADPLQMRQLFQNLLSNALKFRKPDVAPEIQVESRSIPSEPGFCEVIIADNGIGFEPEEADKIFKVFHRLHGRAEYEGTGIGLSVVRKIIDRHGGAIVAKSELGKGAVFLLKLPLQSE